MRVDMPKIIKEEMLRWVLLIYNEKKLNNIINLITKPINVCV